MSRFVISKTSLLDLLYQEASVSGLVVSKYEGFLLPFTTPLGGLALRDIPWDPVRK